MTKIKNDPDKYSVIKERISQWGSQGKNTEVVFHSLLQGTTFCQTSPPWPVCLGWPYTAWLSFIKKRESSKKKNIYFCFIDYAKAFVCVDHNKLWKILQEMRIPDHVTCLLRNLYAGQEATVRMTWNNRLVPNRERSSSRLYIVTLLI